LPRDHDKDFFAKSKKKYDSDIEKLKKSQEKGPSEVKLTDAGSPKVEDILKELNLPGGKTMPSQKEQAKPKEEAKKPMIIEMKDKPHVEATYTDTHVKLVLDVDKETSAKNIDLDIAETELKLESANYELRYKFEKGVTVDSDSVKAKFSKTKH